MSNRQLILLTIIAAGMVILTGVFYLRPSGEQSAFQSGMPLIQGLDPQQIHSITLNRGDQNLTLNRSNDGFVVDNLNNYPASTERINEFLFDVLDITCEDIATENSSRHSTFGVDPESSDSVTVSFRDSNGDPVTGLVRGKNAETGRGAFVRLTEEDTVYRTSETLQLSLDPIEYVNTRPFEVDTDKIRRVKINPGNENNAYEITADDKGEPVLQQQPEGYNPVPDRVGDTFRALDNFRIKAVLPEEELTIDPDAEYVCQLDHLSYRVRTTKKDGRYYAIIRADGPEAEQMEISRSESEESLQEKDTILQAADRAEEFNTLHEHWVYEISDKAADRLRTSHERLIEKQDEEQQQDGQNEDGNTPDDN